MTDGATRARQNPNRSRQAAGATACEDQQRQAQQNRTRRKNNLHMHLCPVRKESDRMTRAPTPEGYPGDPISAQRRTEWTPFPHVEGIPQGSAGKGPRPLLAGVKSFQLCRDSCEKGNAGETVINGSDEQTAEDDRKQ